MEKKQTFFIEMSYLSAWFLFLIILYWFISSFRFYSSLSHLFEGTAICNSQSNSSPICDSHGCPYSSKVFDSNRENVYHRHSNENSQNLPNNLPKRLRPSWFRQQPCRRPSWFSLSAVRNIIYLESKLHYWVHQNFLSNISQCDKN